MKLALCPAICLKCPCLALLVLPFVSRVPAEAHAFKDDTGLILVLLHTSDLHARVSQAWSKTPVRRLTRGATGGCARLPHAPGEAGADRGNVRVPPDAGTFRAPLPDGPVIRGDLTAALPFEDQHVVVGMTGKDLPAVLEHGASPKDAHGGKLQHPESLVHEVDAARPAGSSMLPVRLQEDDGRTRPLRMDEVCRVVLTDWAASGKNRFSMMLGAKRVPGDTASLRSAVEQYLIRHSPVLFDSTPRISRLGGGTPAPLLSAACSASLEALI